MKRPRYTEAQLGFFLLQSIHFYWKTIEKEFNKMRFYFVFGLGFEGLEDGVSFRVFEVLMRGRLEGIGRKMEYLLHGKKKGECGVKI